MSGTQHPQHLGAAGDGVNSGIPYRRARRALSAGRVLAGVIRGKRWGTTAQNGAPMSTQVFQLVSLVPVRVLT
jgi:hypothetical protein